MKRFIGILTAIGMISSATTCIGAGATAYMSSSVPGSLFSYSVSATVVNAAMIGETPKIDVHIETTYNPGFKTLTLFVENDDNCIFDYGRTNVSISGALDMVSEVDDTYTGIYFANSTDYSGLYTADLYYDVSDWYTVSHSFSVGVITYNSTSENIAYNTVYANTQICTDATTQITYMLGDVDGDNAITINDAYLTNLLLSDLDRTSMTTSYLNSQLLTNSTIQSGYPNLLCAEVCDVNFSGTINSTDASQILSYYSATAAGNTLSSLIGTNRVKTITV